VQLTNKPVPNSISDARYEAAVREMQRRHGDEYEEVCNGSGRSEEFPSDLLRRHKSERLMLREDREHMGVMQWIYSHC